MIFLKSGITRRRYLANPGVSALASAGVEHFLITSHDATHVVVKVTPKSTSPPTGTISFADDRWSDTQRNDHCTEHTEGQAYSPAPAVQ